MMRGHLQVIYEQSALPILNPKASAMFLNICRNTCDLMDGRIRATTPMGMPGNTNGYARPLEVDTAIEECRKGNYAAGVAALKRALNRSQVPVPPTESARSQ
jgi:hypothetical protein